MSRLLVLRQRMYRKENFVHDGDMSYIGPEVRTPIGELAEPVGDLGDLRHALVREKVPVSSRIGGVELEHVPGVFCRGPGDDGIVDLNVTGDSMSS